MSETEKKPETAPPAPPSAPPPAPAPVFLLVWEDFWGRRKEEKHEGTETSALARAVVLSKEKGESVHVCAEENGKRKVLHRVRGR